MVFAISSIQRRPYTMKNAIDNAGNIINGIQKTHENQNIK
jgi:hypothetical protein